MSKDREYTPPKSIAQMFGSERPHEREVRLAREARERREAAGRPHTRSADRLAAPVDDARDELAQTREQIREEIADDNEAESLRRERYRGVTSAEILARGYHQRGAPRPARRSGGVPVEPEFDPVERNRQNRKRREAEREQRLRARLARGETI